MTSNAYQQFAGGGQSSGPLQYNVPARSIRGSAGQGNFNDGQGITRQERVDNMVNQALEQFDAQTGIRQQIQQRMDADYQNATRGPLQSINQSFLGPELNRQSYGGNSYTGDAYQRFMNSQSAQGLFGGTRATPEQRYRGWNDQIAQRGNIANQTLGPVYAKYGLQAPTSRPLRIGFGGTLG